MNLLPEFGRIVSLERLPDSEQHSISQGGGERSRGGLRLGLTCMYGQLRGASVPAYPAAASLPPTSPARPIRSPLRRLSPSATGIACESRHLCWTCPRRLS